MFPVLENRCLASSTRQHVFPINSQSACSLLPAGPLHASDSTFTSKWTIRCIDWPCIDPFLCANRRSCLPAGPSRQTTGHISPSWQACWTDSLNSIAGCLTLDTSGRQSMYHRERDDLGEPACRSINTDIQPFSLVAEIHVFISEKLKLYRVKWSCYTISQYKYCK